MVFFHKIKDTFFIFTSNFLYLSFFCLFGYFKYVGYLPWGITLISNNVSIWSLLISTGLPDRGASSKQEISSTKLHKPLWHVCSVTAPSPHTTQLGFFLVFQLHFYLSCNNKAYNMLKMLRIFSVFIIKMATENSLILIFFNVHWYDSII